MKMRSNTNYTRDGINACPPRNQHQQRDNHLQIPVSASQQSMSASGCYRQRLILSVHILGNRKVTMHNPLQKNLGTRKPQQTIIRHPYHSLDQPLCGYTTTNPNALTSNSAVPVTYISNRLVSDTSPLHSYFVANNFRRNKPISFTTNQPNISSVPFYLSGARVVNPPMTTIYPPSQHSQQQFTDHQISGLCGKVAQQPLHSTDANAIRIITNSNQPTRLNLTLSSNDNDQGIISSNNIISQTDEGIKSVDDDDRSVSLGSLSKTHRKRELFPFLLYRLLMDAESNGFMEIVSFLPQGRAFTVRSRFMFEEMVMPMYFSNKQFSSFRRYDCLIVNVIVVHVFGLYLILNICFIDGKAIKFIRLCTNEESKTTRHVLSSQLCSRKSGYVIGKYKICLMISELT